MSKIVRRIIRTANAPVPVGPYSQAVRVNETVYVSGCLGLDKESLKLVPGGAASEAQKALENLTAVLNASGSKIENVVKSTVFLDDINDFSAVNEVYKKFFEEPFPARSCYQVGKLPLNFLGQRICTNIMKVKVYHEADFGKQLNTSSNQEHGGTRKNEAYQEAQNNGAWLLAANLTEEPKWKSKWWPSLGS